MDSFEIKKIVQRFVDYVTDSGEKNDETLLQICDDVVYAFNGVNDTFDCNGYLAYQGPDYATLRAKISLLFPLYGHYCLSAMHMDQFEPNALVGDAFDDLTDLVLDFSEILWRFEQTSPANALWHFQNGYWSHWGFHLRNLQLYLFRTITRT
jgi:hypothetical protein